MNESEAFGQGKQARRKYMSAHACDLQRLGQGYHQLQL